MKDVKIARTVAAVLASAALVVTVASTTAAADAPKLKPAPAVPRAATAAPVLKGSTAAKTVSTGAPTGRLASMASQNGTCEVGDLCLYYFYGPTYGSGYDQSHDEANLDNNHFISAGSGRRAIVGNNAQGYWNRDPRAYAYVCTGVNWAGSCGWLAPNSYGNLKSTYADNTESIFWGDTAN